MVASARQRMTYAEFLAFEEASEVKHEYLRGEVWAMAGGTPSHSRLQANCIMALGTALRGRPCQVFTSDLRVRIEVTDRSTYPDVTVVCGPPQFASDDANAVTNPIVIVEVLSDSTESADRNEKFSHYRRLSSLQEYVLVDHRRRNVEVFRRKGRTWEFIPSEEAGTVELTSLGVVLNIDELYLDPTAPAA